MHTIEAYCMPIVCPNWYLCLANSAAYLQRANSKLESICGSAYTKHACLCICRIMYVYILHVYIIYAYICHRHVATVIASCLSCACNEDTLLSGAVGGMSRKLCGSTEDMYIRSRQMHHSRPHKFVSCNCNGNTCIHMMYTYAYYTYIYIYSA